MSNELIETNKKYFLYSIVMFIVGLIFGLILGVLNSSPKSPKTKEYPIKVHCYWSTDGYQSYPTMDADSVIGDTVYKDGLKIVNKNIINVNFK